MQHSFFQYVSHITLAFIWPYALSVYTVWLTNWLALARIVKVIITLETSTAIVTCTNSIETRLLTVRLAVELIIRRMSKAYIAKAFPFFTVTVSAIRLTAALLQLNLEPFHFLHP